MRKKKRKQDLNKHDEEVTMEVIVEIAESIDDIVKFTVDMPSKPEHGYFGCCSQYKKGGG